MAGKLSVRQLQKIFPNKFETGMNSGPEDRRRAPEDDPRVDGVIDIPSRLLDKAPEEVLRVVMQPRKTVVVVAPFSSEDLARRDVLKRYADRCVLDSIKRGEAPLNSHVFYYHVLNMNVPIERDIGLHSMLSWVPKCDIVAVYIDFGVSQAMQVLINTAELKNRKIEYRVITKIA